MKIWWPWRKNKVQSLFEGRVPWAEEGLTDLSPTTRILGAYPKNAPGPFYVENQECMICGVPHTVAPDLMAWDTDAENRPEHCYFKKQPTTPEEFSQAIEAIKSSCCGALSYKGSDPEIIKQLRKAGCRDQIKK